MREGSKKEFRSSRKRKNYEGERVKRIERDENIEFLIEELFDDKLPSQEK